MITWVPVSVVSIQKIFIFSCLLDNFRRLVVFSFDNLILFHGPREKSTGNGVFNNLNNSLVEFDVNQGQHFIKLSM